MEEEGYVFRECEKCGKFPCHIEAVYQWNGECLDFGEKEEYWIDGHFFLWGWGSKPKKSYYSHDRDIYIPKYAVVRVEPERIYITKKYAESQKLLYKHKVLDMTNVHDLYLITFNKILNKEWEKEKYSGPPTSLP